MSDRQRGIIFMLASAVIFALMAAVVRALQNVDAYTMAAARFAIGTLVCLAIFATGRDKPRWTAWPWLLGRGLVGGCAVVLLYWSIQNVGLAKSLMLSYLYVAFAAMLAVPVLGERMSPKQWVAVLAAVAGAVILCGPENLTLGRSDWVPLLSALCSAVAVICVARCRETDTSTNIFWSQAVFGLLIVAWPATQSWVPPSAPDWLWLLVIGLLASAGQLSMTYAYKHTGASQGSLLSLLTPVLTAVIGVLWFREAHGGGFVPGSAMIIGACVYMALNPVAKSAQKALANGKLPPK